jgi:hypothetical protein
MRFAALVSVILSLAACQGPDDGLTLRSVVPVESELVIER